MLSLLCYFLMFCISQGSVGPHIRCSGKYNDRLAENFLSSSDERIMKIGQHLPMLCLRTELDVFLTQSVIQENH